MKMTPLKITLAGIFTFLTPFQAAEWIGSDGNLQNAANWNPNGIPGNSEPLLFNGQGVTTNLYYGTSNTSFQGGGNGVGGITLTSAQTAPVTINNTGANLTVFRLAGNTGILIQEGAGALTFGNSQNQLLFNLGGASGSSTFTNNSSQAATFGAQTALNRGGGSTQHLTFSGSGNWNILGDVFSLDSLNKTGTGTLHIQRNLNSPSQLYWDEGTVNVANGLSTQNMRVGYDNKTAVVTIQGGGFNVGAGAAGQNFFIAEKVSDTPATATSGTLNASAASSVSIHVDELRMGRNSTSAGSSVTANLTLSSTGANTVRARRFIMGQVTGGSTTASNTTLTLGAQNQFYVDEWIVGGDKSRGTVTISNQGTLQLSGNLSSLANLTIGSNEHSNTGTNPAESHLNLSNGTFNASLNVLKIGTYTVSQTGGSAKGRLTYGAGNVTANEVILAAHQGTTPQNTQGILTQNGGSLTVSGGIQDGGGVSRLQINGGTASVGTGLTVDHLQVGTEGRDGSLQVLSGNVVIGDASDPTSVLVGYKNTQSTNHTSGIINLANASSVQLRSTDLKVAVNESASSINGNVLGTLTLSQTGSNFIESNQILLGHIQEGSVTNTVATLNLGAGQNEIKTDTMTVGGAKAQGLVSLASGGTLTLTGKNSGLANLSIGNNEHANTGSSPNESHMNLSGGTFNASIDHLKIASYNVNNGGGSAKGRLTFEDGLVTANLITLASTSGSQPQNTVGVLVQNGGELRAERILKGRGNAQYQFNQGTLRLSQFGDASQTFHFQNTGSGVLDVGLSTTLFGQSEIFGDYTQGSQATLHFDIGAQGNDLLKVHGNIALNNSLLELDVQGSAPALYSDILLIDNMGSNAVSGTFANFAEGQQVALNFGGQNVLYSFTYLGGDGNDVLLVAPEVSKSLLFLLAACSTLTIRRRNA